MMRRRIEMMRRRRRCMRIEMMMMMMMMITHQTDLSMNARSRSPACRLRFSLHALSYNS
jgi:hypothetical protein